MPGKFVIDYLEFPSADGAATSKFFEAAFGWSGIDYGPGYTRIAVAGMDAGVDAQAERVAAPPAVIRTDDLERALERVIAAGGAITREPFDYPGGRRFHFREPGGCELAVWIAHAE